MDRDTLQHVFEPFFTTKSPGKGTGLGLATIYGIARQNSGFVNVYSEPGSGTTFKIYLPRHYGEIVQSDTGTKEISIIGDGEVILVVEDEISILQLAEKMLGSLGYRVLTASTPSQAISVVEQFVQAIDLLITDVIMPEMNGKELASRLREICPRLKTLFMSGYTANVIAHQGVLESGVCFMAKPFSKQDIAGKVRLALGNSDVNVSIDKSAPPYH